MPSSRAMAGACPTGSRSPTRRSKTPGVTSAVPLIEQPLMATANGRVEGVLLRGMRARGHPREPDASTRNVVAGDIALGQPGQQPVAVGSRLAEMLGLSAGGADHLVEPGGPLDVVRDGAARRHLHGRRDLRDRRLRLRQGVRDHADAGRAEIAADGRPGRDDRDPDHRSRPGRSRSSRRSGSSPGAAGDDHRLAPDELGLVPGACRSSGWRCSSCCRSSSSSPCSTSSRR